jgi:hypothetical protein
MSKAWFDSIPPQYRWTKKPRKGNGEPQFPQSFAAAPGSLLERFFASIKQHLTAKQPQAKAAREMCGRVGLRSDGLEASPHRRHRSQARMRPSLPTMVARAETCVMLPE